MKHSVFEPEAIYDDDEPLDVAYYPDEGESYYPDEDVWLEEPQESISHLPETFSQGPTTRHIITATLGLGFLLMFGLLSYASRVSITIQTASVAAGEVQAQETVLAAQAPAEQTAAAQEGDCSVSELFPAKVRKWCVIITKYANKHSLDPNLVAAVIWLESGGNETAFSHSGAVGLMQVMPSDGPSASFMCANGPCFSDRPTIQELNDPEFNISYGTRMLAGLVRRTGDVREALRSYGPMDAGYTYADKVLGLFQRYGK